VDEIIPEPPDTLLVNAAKGSRPSPLPPGDIRGIDNHQLTNIDIGIVVGVIQTQKEPIIGILNQYALLKKGSNIHSPCQLEWYKNDVNDKSINGPGHLQCILTIDGYFIPLCIKGGLSRLSIRTYTDHKSDNLPDIILTSKMEWDPSALDYDMK
jgi:hypothetical protein